ncbi:thiamine pyrophosphate-binding protein [Cupriavidus sp. 30B13]|uniref:thiamine pyrophosphate-binding protein n=1 Tax=Cupriavidus sp. 30B13 TaxID=3384241 RepID=UPI003B8F2ABA
MNAPATYQAMEMENNPTDTTATVSAGKALADALHRRGVERIFCVPGESYLDVLDALYDYPDIDVIVAKHEGAAANMAEADGKLSGKPGICFVTRGPGASHAAIGVHIAQQDSTPMILFVGQVPSGERGRDGFQEIDYRGMFGSIAKWVTELDDAERLEEVLHRAFHVASSGRPGPVVIALPEDVLAMPCRSAAALHDTLPRSAPDPRDVDEVIARLRAAQRPLVLLGGTGWSPEGLDSLRRFVEAWQLPVAVTFRHQDMFDNRHPCYVGHLGLGVDPALADSLRSADLVLAVGTRLGDVSTGAYTYLQLPYPAQFLVHVYPANEDLGRVYAPQLPVCCAPSAWAAAVAAHPGEPAAPWAGHTRATREQYLRFSAAPAEDPEFDGVNLTDVVKHLSDKLPADGIVTNGAGNYTGWVHRFFTYKQPGTCLAPTNGSMGYGLPAAIAASLRHPEREVVCFAGDGCFLMYAQELATAVQYGARIIVIVVNNGMYGTIRMYQEKRFPGRQVATRLQGPDFVKLAQSFGAHGELVTHAGNFAAAWERARARNTAALIELRVDPAQITPQARLPRAAAVNIRQ